jgi:hypothetical protein
LCAGRYVIVAIPDAEEKSAEDRLHHVVGVDAGSKTMGCPGPDQGSKAAAISLIKMSGGYFVALA